MKFTWIALTLCAAASADAVEREYLKDWRTKMAGIVPAGYVCHHVQNAPQVDGILNDPAWENAAWTDDFVDIEGSAKPKPALRTRVKMLWDDDFFYIAAELAEPQVWATLTKHDSVIFQDPDFEVFIDPDGDTHEYGEFEMNALNTTWDLLLPKPYKDGGEAVDAWEITGLKSAVHVDGTLNDSSDRDLGWSLEIAIPWKSLERLRHLVTAPAEFDRWRINFSRVEWQVVVENGTYVKLPQTPESNWVWSPQGVIDMHRPEMWGYVLFAKDHKVGTPNHDPSALAKKFLFEAYYTQKDFFKLNKHWASTFGDVGIAGKLPETLGDAKLRQTDSGYQCEITQHLPKLNARWRIDQYGKLMVVIED